MRHHQGWSRSCRNERFDSSANTGGAPHCGGNNGSRPCRDAGMIAGVLHNHWAKIWAFRVQHLGLKVVNDGDMRELVDGSLHHWTISDKGQMSQLAAQVSRGNSTLTRTSNPNMKNAKINTESRHIASR